MGSHPEMNGYKPLKLCRCLVHIRSTSEHSVQIILNFVPGQLFHSAAEKGSMPLTGTAETKICATTSSKSVRRKDITNEYEFLSSPPLSTLTNLPACS